MDAMMCTRWNQGRTFLSPALVPQSTCLKSCPHIVSALQHRGTLLENR
ncbi:sodium stibogluconate resistance protein, putative [Leishmania tarentolae]|uniref:Sodium stibogluconate resistance protein, putative n=1 Tax=Leishmania tarentolae TaxID=5689 RepID=A0A640L2K9_LEITA|nr:sodium stibogluconate resistance protein, putative [Leishmania tarentolae]